jgi:hypothetical protein
MRVPTIRNIILVFGLVIVMTGISVPSAGAARSCNPVVNPYSGTRYEGINLTGIRGKGVDCFTARKVAKKAHRKALGLPPTSPRRFTWRKWKVTGYLEGSKDRYVAKAGFRVIRWRF